MLGEQIRYNGFANVLAPEVQCSPIVLDSAI
jgi:hypothetical protein